MCYDIEGTILDSFKPNPGRIYMYLLGHGYYFIVDSDVAQEIKEIFHFAPKIAYLVRVFLRKGTDKALELGLTQFIDFASGIADVANIHTIVPPGIKVIYSDIDPHTVRVGEQIIGDNPNVLYLHCDIREPEILLQSDKVNRLIKKNHKVAIGFNGICYFLTDDEIHSSLNTIYNWAAKGSIVFFCDIDLDRQKVNTNVQKLADIYKEINSPFYFRSKEQMMELVKPWNVLEPDFLNLEKWHELPSTFSDAVAEFIGGGIGFYGGILIK